MCKRIGRQVREEWSSLQLCVGVRYRFGGVQKFTDVLASELTIPGQGVGLTVAAATPLSGTLAAGQGQGYLVPQRVLVRRRLRISY